MPHRMTSSHLYKHILNSLIYVIVHARRRKACPAEDRGVATILYGYPLFSKELKKGISEACIVLGGCTTNGDGSDPI